MNVFNITELYKMVMMVLFMLRMFYYNKKFEKNVNSLNIVIDHLPHGKYWSEHSKFVNSC